VRGQLRLGLSEAVAMMTIQWENVNCNLCGSGQRRPFFAGPDARYADSPRAMFQLVRCTGCGLIYLNPRPTGASLAAFYPATYDVHHQSAELPAPVGRGLAGINQRIWHWISRRKTVEKQRLAAGGRTVPGRILDVGCASGRFLAGMRALGWEVAGVELNAGAAERARVALGPVVQTGVLETVPISDAQFDVVTMFHVLEHVPDPRGTLARVFQLLRPGGQVVLLVPNARSWEFGFLGRRDPNPVDIPRHLYHFSPAVLQRLLRENGFTVARARRFSWNVTPRLSSVLQTRIEGWSPAGNIGRMTRGLGMLGAWALGIGLGWLAGALANCGPGFYLVGRKPVPEPES
jgi:SAM-dependent methyltransferase